MVKLSRSSKEKLSKKTKAAKRLTQLPISRILPNIITLMALCTGISAIRFALIERYELSVIAILIAALLDAMDGRLARMLGTSSHFGAELDSLADFASFGIAPSILIYSSSLKQWNGFGWSIVLFFVICGALRLARFNTDSLKSETSPDWHRNFFIGIPIPVGAIIAMLSIIFSFALDNAFYTAPWFSAPFLILSGSLMISRIPTYSLKGQEVQQKRVLPIMLGVGIGITSLITAFWITLSIFGIAYLISIPIGYKSFKRQEKLNGL